MAAKQLSIEGRSQIADFYSNKKIFITGASGFMGKVLVERLLSACPGIDQIYLLLRGKKNVLPQQRLQTLKDSQVFDNIRHTNPGQLEKLEVLEGDIVQEGLALSQEARKLLESVSIVFHTAATIKFDEELKSSADMNILAPIRVMKLAETMPQLEAFVHVSTAYCNCDHKEVEEKVYPPPADLQQFLALCEALPTQLLADITEKYIGNRPNTYTFTKAMGEHAVLVNSGKFPIAIFRPTIVIASLSRPFPGWVDTFAGPTGLIVGAGKGIVRTILCKRDLITDMIPVDLAIDTLIAVGWQTAMERSNDVKVYNCGTGDVNPLTWGMFVEYLKEYLRDIPFDGCLWYPGGDAHEHRFLDKLHEIAFQTIPVHVAQYIVRIFGIDMKGDLIKVNQRLTAAKSLLLFFSNNEWTFHTTNVQKLNASLSPADARLFNLDPASIDWRQFFYNYVKGARKYLLKEKDEDIDKARRRMRKMRYLHYGLQCLLFILFLRFVLMRSENARKLLSVATRFLLSTVTSSYKSIV